MDKETKKAIEDLNNRIDKVLADIEDLSSYFDYRMENASRENERTIGYIQDYIRHLQDDIRSIERSRY